MAHSADDVSMEPTEAADADSHPADELLAGELLPEEFYTEGPYVVFTAAYHLRRGYCCNSDCRHCPYK